MIAMVTTNRSRRQGQIAWRRDRIRRCHSVQESQISSTPAIEAVVCWQHSIPRSGKGHEVYEDNGAHPRLTRCDLFDNGELLWRIGRPQRHNEPATHFELLNQRRRDMPKCGCHDHGVKRTAFRPSLITVADLNTHIVIAELSQHIRGGFGQWWDNLNGADLSHQTRQYCGLIT